jgi:hypothetical protein
MNAELAAPVSKEEIEWVRAKHAGIMKSSRRILKEAIEIGEWFVEADQRMGLKRTIKGGRGGEWRLWLGAHFPEIHVTTIGNYMRLASGRKFLEQHMDLSEEPQRGLQLPSIKAALRLLSKRDQQQAEEAEPALPAEFEEPLLILRDQLKSYVYQQFQLQYLAEQIRFRIKTEKLGRRQIRQAVEWATQEHLEVRDMVLKAFLR